jgi:CBS domain-containing protein
VPSYIQQLTTGKVMAVRKVAGRVIADPRGLPVREAMRRNVICVDEHQTVAEGRRPDGPQGSRPDPRGEEGALVGILVRSDLVRKVIGSVKRES